MTAQHTPGPWIHTPFSLRYLSVHADSGDPHDSRGRICLLDEWTHAGQGNIQRNRAEVEANAALIARSPTLLAENQQLRAIVQEAYDMAEQDRKATGDARIAALCHVLRSALTLSTQSD